MDRTRLFDRMHADHRRVLDEVAEMQRAAGCDNGAAPASAVDAPALRALVSRMEHAFALHMTAEDEVLFPAIAQALPHAVRSLEPLQDDHRELRAMLAGLAELLEAPAGPARDEQLAVVTRDFADLLRIHIRKEEAVAFRIAEPVLRPDELERLAERWIDAAPAASPESTPTPGKEPRP